jgi:acetoin utilization protein AcuA
MLGKEGRRAKDSGEAQGETGSLETPTRAGGPLKPPLVGEFGKVPSLGEAPTEEEPESPVPPKKNSSDIETPRGTVHIENYCPAEMLKGLTVDEGICMFSRHNPDRQKRALVNVAEQEGGNVIAGTSGGLLISYVGIHRPSEKERWGKPGYPWLFELGAIEVSRNYRELGLAVSMLDAAFNDPFYEDKIVLTTAFTWHWDLEVTGMTKMQYRELFINLAAKYGFIEMATDEPNITMDSANLFLVRLGKNASFSKYQRFASLLFTNEWEAMLRGF